MLICVHKFENINYLFVSPQYCCKSATDNDLVTFNVINIFDIPQFVYNLDRKKFLPRPSSQPVIIFGNPISKCNIYKDR